MDKKYYIIILNWNGWLDTKECIKSIHNNTSSNDYTIIVIDNGSSLEEIKMIESYCQDNYKNVISDIKDNYLNGSIVIRNDFKQSKSKDKIIFIKNNENLGFAAGNNIALRFLKNINEDYAILLNNDTEVEEGALDNMFNFLIKHESKKIVAIIPQIRYFKPNNIIWNCGGNINWLGIRKYFFALKDIEVVPQEGVKEVVYGTGCALFININKTGLLTEKFFLGEEDMEFAYRLKRQNMKIVCLFNSVIYHKVGSSRVKISEEKMGNMVYHYSLRMSNLKDHLSYPIWVLSFILHYFSTVRILKNESFFSFSKINAMWKDIYNNVRDIKKFTREDFIRITNKKY